MTDRLILIVEDDPDIRDALSIGLVHYGFRVATASDGIKGLRAIERERPSLVLLDTEMPSFDGRALAQRLGRHDKQLPTIVFGADANAVAYAHEIGAVEWLPKPFGFRRLLSSVRSVVNPGA